MRIHPLAIPVIVVLAIAAGYFGRSLFALPTTATVVGDGEGARVECIVDGVKCQGTATFFTSLFDDVEGIKGIETFAADHKAIITYDEALISTERIRQIIEQEVRFSDGSTGRIFHCQSMNAI